MALLPVIIKVAILEHRPNSNAAGTQLVPAKLDLKYADLNSSGLKVDIKPGKNDISFAWTAPWALSHV